MKNYFARFARAFFISWHFEDVHVLSTTWNDLFCSCVDDVSIWWQMFNLVFLCPKRWLIPGQLADIFQAYLILNNWKMIAEARSYIFRWRSRFRRRRVGFLKLPNREFTQPRRRRQQESHKFAYLVKNNSFARFARAFLIFDISLTFSFFLRRELTCFAVV